MSTINRTLFGPFECSIFLCKSKVCSNAVLTVGKTGGIGFSVHCVCVHEVCCFKLCAFHLRFSLAIII